MRNSILKMALAAVAASTLTGCATLSSEGGPVSLDLLRDALTTPVDVLESQASQNKGRAQYALAIVYEYGLHRTPLDRGRAAELKRAATASHGTMPITQYIAGLNGKPGRTAIINVPQYDVTIFEGRASDNCAQALNTEREAVEAYDLCQGESSYKTFKMLWEHAKSD